jgi:RHS repeat-associated protein
VDGARVKQWLHKDALNPVAELDGSGNLVRQFVYAAKPNIPKYMERGGQEYRIITDHLGSLRLVVNASTGEIKQRMLHDEHGNVAEDWLASGRKPVPFGYGGGLYDRDIGLVRFGAGNYDPEVGRCVQPDPIGFSGGDGNLHTTCRRDPRPGYRTHALRGAVL